MQLIRIPKSVIECKNYVDGQWKGSALGAAQTLAVKSPYTGQVIGQVQQSQKSEVNEAVEAAAKAGLAWADSPIKERTQVMFKFREILLRELDTISHTISAESGKLLAESRAGLLKGVEVLEFAISLQNLDAGGKMQVSRGVFCEYRREALGVVVGITPFNFPAMVPMWMIPIALTLGNSFVWKPSDKTPLTSLLIAQALVEAGLPKGVLTIVQGGKAAVDALCDHPLVQAVAFVGSTPVAKSVYARATSNGKRALCLGGAKNHIILMPDADPSLVTEGVVASFTGCAGQRCMAASALVAVGEGSEIEPLIAGIVKRAESLVLGKDMGAIISEASLKKIHAAIEQAEAQGARILLDGRKAKAPEGYESGYWIGPTILDQVDPQSPAAKEELFGPVLSIVRAKNLSQAIEIENQSPYGNAASVFTQQGSVAEEVARRSRAGMIGVNIGVPVPREPFSFGGLYESKFGHGDITGPSSLDFWSALKKVTTKWALQKDNNWMS